MGLGIAQVRLLALTHRKSDIELEMSIDSKRKQQLTRKSTELAHDYYSKLNNYNYQYSTTGGFNDLDYNYLMGECNANGTFSKRFLNQIYYGTGDVDTKIDNRVILTNSKGQVILNDELIKCVAHARSYNYLNLYDDSSSPTIADQTAYAIWNFVKQNTQEQGYSALEHLFSGNITESCAGFKFESDNPNERIGAINDVIRIIKMLMENGGVQQGGTVYLINESNVTIDPNTSYDEDGINGVIGNINDACEKGRVYKTKEGGKTTLKAGTCYTVENVTSEASGIVSKTTCVQDWLWDGEQFIPNMRADMLQYLANIVDYLAPMLSAALQNGYTGTIHLDRISVPSGYNTVNGRVAECNELLAYIDTLTAPTADPDAFSDFQDKVAYDGSTSKQWLAATTIMGRGNRKFTTDRHTDWANAENQVYYDKYTYMDGIGIFIGSIDDKHDTITNEYYTKYKTGGAEALGVGEYRIVNVNFAGTSSKQLAFWNDGSGTLKSSPAEDSTFKNFLYVLDKRGAAALNTFWPGGHLSIPYMTSGGMSAVDMVGTEHLQDSCATILGGANSDRYVYNTIGSFINSDYVVQDDRFLTEALDDIYSGNISGVCRVGGRYFAGFGDGAYTEISATLYNSYMSASPDSAQTFNDVQDVSTLQDGLKSGVYQLCMVDNVNTGAYHKNTTMDYFIHRNLCVEKIDMSKREELTAWYNAEQAALSDQESYWDEEITNLSTELTAVNQEIDSVKSLKSNAIKSVFGWGGN